MLIDAANNWNGVQITNYLKSLGVSRIDYLIATHAHADHIGGMDTIINNFEIGTIHMPDTDHPTLQMRQFLEAMLENDLQYELVEIGDIIHLGNTVIEVLFVDNSMPATVNDASIVLQMTYGEKTYLFMADAEKSTEDALKWDPVDVLRVGHHGSNTSSTRRFLEQTTPEISIISVGEGNRYNHPRVEVLDRLAAVGSRIYRTDLHGTIWISSDGSSLSITLLSTLEETSI